MSSQNLDTIISGITFYRLLWHGDHEIPYTCVAPGHHIHLAIAMSSGARNLWNQQYHCHCSTIFSQPPSNPLHRAAQGNGFGQISTRTELRHQGHGAGGVEEVQHCQQVGMHPQLLPLFRSQLVHQRVRVWWKFVFENRGTIMIDECPKSNANLFFGVSY